MTELETRHDIFQAISDPTRRMILRLLAEREMSISAIKSCFPLSRTAVNKHLRILEDAKAVEGRKTGRETRYSLNPGSFRDVKEWISFFDSYWEGNLKKLKSVLE